MQVADFFEMYKTRRLQIIKQIQNLQPDCAKGILMLFANFETTARYKFRQDSSFYYLTGISEPAAVFCSYFDSTSVRDVLYIPNYGDERKKWMNVQIDLQKDSLSFAIDEIKSLGRQIGGYIFSPNFNKETYQNLVEDVDTYLAAGARVFTLYAPAPSCDSGQLLLDNLARWVPAMTKVTRDCSDFVNLARRVKSEHEINLINSAVGITVAAHDAACKVILPGRMEYEIQAAIEYVFTYAGAQRAFNSIIAAGQNTTILHYSENTNQLQPRDLLVVDVGAEWGMYSADITRTYPVAGRFSPRQLEVYNAVLATQEYVESIAMPGMYLKNSKEPEKSLHHLAIKFLNDLGFAKYFVHGIGHFLGLDLHDVGSYEQPLMDGDVFTIEPGIYIPQELLGVRIEDDYVMTSQGPVCLSGELPKQAEEIEELMSGEFF
jgi:Xaa-Pro aminopeptidase